MTCKSTCKSLSLGVIPLRFERRTYCLEGSCSIQLSYGTVCLCRDSQTRTDDLLLPKQAYYQLYYIPFFRAAKIQLFSLCLPVQEISFFLLCYYRMGNVKWLVINLITSHLMIRIQR